MCRINWIQLFITKLLVAYIQRQTVQPICHANMGHYILKSGTIWDLTNLARFCLPIILMPDQTIKVCCLFQNLQPYNSQFLSVHRSRVQGKGLNSYFFYAVLNMTNVSPYYYFFYVVLDITNVALNFDFFYVVLNIKKNLHLILISFMLSLI